MRRSRVVAAAVVCAGLWVLAATSAYALDHCSGEFDFDARACEVSHHGPLPAIVGAASAAVAIAVGAGLTGGTATQPTGGRVQPSGAPPSGEEGGDLEGASTRTGDGGSRPGDVESLVDADTERTPDAVEGSETADATAPAESARADGDVLPERVLDARARVGADGQGYVRDRHGNVIAHVGHRVNADGSVDIEIRDTSGNRADLYTGWDPDGPPRGVILQDGTMVRYDEHGVPIAERRTEAPVRADRTVLDDRGRVLVQTGEVMRTIDGFEEVGPLRDAPRPGPARPTTDTHTPQVDAIWRTLGAGPNGELYGADGRQIGWVDDNLRTTTMDGTPMTPHRVHGGRIDSFTTADGVRVSSTGEVLRAGPDTTVAPAPGEVGVPRTISSESSQDILDRMAGGPAGDPSLAPDRLGAGSDGAADAPGGTPAAETRAPSGDDATRVRGADDATTRVPGADDEATRVSGDEATRVSGDEATRVTGEQDATRVSAEGAETRVRDADEAATRVPDEPAARAPDGDEATTRVAGADEAASTAGGADEATRVAGADEADTRVSGGDETTLAPAGEGDDVTRVAGPDETTRVSAGDDAARGGDADATTRVTGEAEAGRAQGDADGTRAGGDADGGGGMNVGQRVLDAQAVQNLYQQHIAAGKSPAEAMALAVAQVSAGNLAGDTQPFGGVTDPRMGLAGGMLMGNTVSNAVMADSVVQNFVGTGYDALTAAAETAGDAASDAPTSGPTALDRFAEGVRDRPGADPLSGYGRLADLLGEESTRTEGSLFEDAQRVVETGAGAEVLNEGLDAFSQRVAEGKEGAALQGLGELTRVAADLTYEPGETVGQFAEDAQAIAETDYDAAFWDEVGAHNQSVADSVPGLGTVARGYGELARGVGEQGALGFAEEMAEGYAALRDEAYEAAADATARAAESTYEYLRSWFGGTDGS